MREFVVQLFEALLLFVDFGADVLQATGLRRFVGLGMGFWGERGQMPPLCGERQATQSFLHSRKLWSCSKQVLQRLLLGMFVT